MQHINSKKVAPSRADLPPGHAEVRPYEQPPGDPAAFWLTFNELEGLRINLPLEPENVTVMAPSLSVSAVVGTVTFRAENP